MLAFVFSAFFVTWFSRNLIPVDVWVRILLPFGWIAVWSLACFGAGLPMIRFFVGKGRLPLVVHLAAGAVMLSWLATLGAWLQMFSAPALRGIFLLSLAGGVYGLLRYFGEIELYPEGVISPTGAILIIPAALTAVVLTTSPVMYDVLHYHLAFPQQWLIHGGFLEFPREDFSYYPSAHGMLYAYALAIVGPWGANAINWWFGLLAVLLAGHLGRRLAGPRATGWAMLCLLLTPAVLQISGNAIADLAVGAFGGTALFLLLAEQRPSAGRLALAGAMAGAAAAAKYLALATVLIPLLALLVYLVGAPWERKFLVGAGIFGAAFLLVSGPWLLRNALWTGNPFYPYLHIFFGGKDAVLNIGVDLRNNVDLPGNRLLDFLYSAGAFVRRSFFPRAEAGFIGPHWLVLLVSAAGIRFAERRFEKALWLFSVVGMLCWGFLVQYIRFLVPVLIPAAALAGGALSVLLLSFGKLTRFMICGFFIFVFGWNLTVLATPFFSDRLLVVSGRMGEQEFRAHWDDVGAAADFVAAELPEDAKIYLLGESRSFGFMRPVVVEDPYHTPLIVHLGQSAASPSGIARDLRRMGVTHILINWREIPRLARYHGRETVDHSWDYWYPATPQDRKKIFAFLDHGLKTVYESDGVVVGEIGDPKTVSEDSGS